MHKAISCIISSKRQLLQTADYIKLIVTEM